jgi:V/A-type H+-transporting ATPase subunit I
MEQLSALVMKEDADKLTRKLLNLGVMDFIDLTELDKELSGRLSSQSSPEAQTEAVRELKKRIEMFLSNGNIELPERDILDAEHLEPVDIGKAEKYLETLSAQVQEIRDQQQRLQQEINRNEELLDQVSLFSEISELTPTGSYADATAGTIGKSRLSSLKQGLAGLPVYLHTIEEEEMELKILLIHLMRDNDKVSAALDRVQWKRIDIPPEMHGVKPEVVDRITQKTRKAREEQEKLAHAAEKIISDRRDELISMWKNLVITEQCGSMQAHYGSTGNTVLVTGWIPARKKVDVTKCFDEAANGRYYMEWRTPEQDKQIERGTVPVSLEHSRKLAPFQWLVENYSLPQYGTIDPTGLVAVTYLLMFGLMFGDAGHGAVLAAVGALVLLIRRRGLNKTEIEKDTVSKLAKLIIWCGASAIVMGILFGSYFGYPWVPALWFDYHSIVSGHGGGPDAMVSSIYDILGITIKFGIGVIGLGILLNCINRIKSRDYMHLLFDTGGILGGWFYAGGVAAGFSFVSSGYRNLPSGGVLFWSIGLPLLLFAAKAPVRYLAEQKKSATAGGFKPSLILDFIMDWVVELLELFTGYLSNTLSFMRIAGLGIAHVSLMTAFFQIAETTGSGIASVAILVLGNAVVIVLEGLSAGIQSLRLHYYEFFTKYFCGSGRVYRPISLRRVEA